MTATVISLDSRRRRDHDAPACCPRHQVEALLVRVQTAVRDQAGQMLTPTSVLTELAADVIATVTAALTDPTERSTDELPR